MKRIGLVGGLGPEATVDYYNGIINAFKNEEADLNYPEIIVYSVNMSVFIGLMKNKEYDKAVDELVLKLISLQSAGADFAAITANTPHMLFRQLTEKSPLPLISIVEVTCDECVARGFKRTGLFGTGFTMNSTFYQDVFSKRGIEVVLPDHPDRVLINQKLFTEIEIGIFRDETRQLLIGIIEKMVKEQSIDSLILGCTELPLILTAKEYAGIPMLNTTMLHVGAIVKQCSE